MRFSRTRSSVSRLSACSTTPSFDRISGPESFGSRPRIDRVPLVRGDTAPPMRMVVDLPAPLGPSSPNDSPGATSNEMPSTAAVSPYFLTRSVATITGAAGGPPSAYEMTPTPDNPSYADAMPSRLAALIAVPLVLLLTACGPGTPPP